MNKARAVAALPTCSTPRESQTTRVRIGTRTPAGLAKPAALKLTMRALASVRTVRFASSRPWRSMTGSPASCCQLPLLSRNTNQPLKVA
jgi:hypothetical protein